MGPQVIELEPIKDANKRKANAKRSRECYLEMKHIEDARHDPDLPYNFAYTFYCVRWDTYFLVNRVENQKLNQTTAELPFG